MWKVMGRMERGHQFLPQLKRREGGQRCERRRKEEGERGKGKERLLQLPLCFIWAISCYQLSQLPGCSEMPLSHPGILPGIPHPHITHIHIHKDTQKHSDREINTHKAQTYFYNSKGTSSKNDLFRWEIPGELKDTVMCF